MTPGHALMAQQLRELAERATSLAYNLDAGKLWPGQLVDGLRTIGADARKLERAVEESRPRVSRSGRW